MTTQTITSSAAAAREAGRTTGGLFGTQPLSEADLDLEATGATGAVEVDASVHRIPAGHYVDHAAHRRVPTTRARDFAAEDGPLAGFLAARGGGQVYAGNFYRLNADYPEIRGSWTDPEIGAVEAIFSTVGNRVELDAMRTADRTIDLKGTPAWLAARQVAGADVRRFDDHWEAVAQVQLSDSDRQVLASIDNPYTRIEAERTIRAMTSTGFAPAASGYDEVDHRLYYELEDGNRLEITRHPGRSSSDVWVSHDPEDTGHADYYEDTESTTSDFYPATLRTTVDRAVSGYVFARSAREDLGARSMLQYQNVETAAPVDGFTVSEIPISMTGEKVKIVETETGDLTVSALSEEGQDLIYAPSRRAEVLQATMLRADRPNVTADRITAAITTAHHKATRARIEDPNWTRFAGDSA
ncbi:hypothetical protein [Kocuria arenosa]|uniref:hypothetical protein n=1 Tax=Kocuria arenosa TaxID=3071446 RepID=UPI0034D5A6A8